MTHRAETAKTNPVVAFIKAEPVVTAAVAAFVLAVITVAVSFGAPITDEQTAAINGIVGPALGLAFLLVRQFVTPASKDEEKTDAPA